MKLAPFFAISAVLHAVVLFYSFPFVPPIYPRFIPVTILGIDEPGGGSGQAGIAKAANGSMATTPKIAKKNGTTSFSLPADRHFSNVGEQVVSAAQPAREATPLIAEHITEPDQQPGPLENSSASIDAGRNDPNAAFASLPGAGSGGPGGSGSGGGHGQGSGGAGEGAGSGSGISRGDFRLTQVRYRETPKPLYPERARQQGQQGRVLLRVLVDREGRPKAVELGRSSGSETLDRAAVEAIRLWRFSPARYGDKPVEAWVRIPVDFRLTDTGEE